METSNLLEKGRPSWRSAGLWGEVGSLFEAHTDIIQKGNRENTFGHKLYMSVGKTALILDALLVRGNLADSQQVTPP